MTKVKELQKFSDYERTNNIDKVIRIFNTYGPNMQRNDEEVIINFIVQEKEIKYHYLWRWHRQSFVMLTI